MQRLRPSLLVVLLAVAATASAGTVLYVEPNPVPIPAGQTPDSVAAAIKSTLKDQDWVIVDEAPGRIEAALEARGRKVRIRAEYDNASARFVFAGGEKLEQEQRDGRLYVDSVYMGWANDLTERLGAQFTPEPDDEALPPMIATEPATQSTARPVIRLVTPTERAQELSRWKDNPVAYLFSVTDVGGVELLPTLKRKGFFGDFPPREPLTVDPGRYLLGVNCWVQGYPYSYGKRFPVSLETHSGIQYVVDCVGHRGPEIRPQITPLAQGQ